MMLASLKTLLHDLRGTAAIETAIVAPVLAMMLIGTFEVGTVVARQHELQSAANEVEIIILATNLGAEVEVSTVKDIIRDSVDLPADSIVVEREFRCDMSNGKIKDKGNCPSNSVVSEYVNLEITDSYSPTWTAFGVGKEITFTVNRTVQIA